MVSGKPMAIEAGPNWDDDLGGSSIYAANDPGVKELSEEEQRQLFALERMVFFYLPRICNHCVNAGCVAACPSGAIYKRGEDGIVLISQDKCRGWRMCVSGCPYKKTYYTWSSGKSEKCILCYPRQESGQAPACFHACVGRIRYLGVLLYDADRIAAAAAEPDERLVEAQREMILDPFDPEVVEAGPALRHRRAGAGGRPALPGLPVCQGVAHRPAAAPRVPDPADALLRAAAAAGALRRGTGDHPAGGGLSSAPWRMPACRCAIWRGSSPQGTRRRSARSTAS